MAFEYQRNRDLTGVGGRTADLTTFDAGLRSYMQRVYNIMGAGLVITGLVAWFTANVPALASLFLPNPLTGQVPGLFWVAAFSPLAFIMVLNFGIMKLSSQAAIGIFALFSATMGLSMASIFIVYTQESIARTFFITAATFLAMSLWGYATRRSLAGVGHFMIMGVFGILIASVVNIFLGSTALQFAISVLGVLIFTGLTAWDTQRIKEMYAESHGAEMNAKLALMGALSLYLDFINLFQFLLQFMGRRE